MFVLVFLPFLDWVIYLGGGFSRPTLAIIKNPATGLTALGIAPDAIKMILRQVRLLTILQSFRQMQLVLRFRRQRSAILGKAGIFSPSGGVYPWGGNFFL